MITARLDAVSEIGESMGSSQASQNIEDLAVVIRPEISHVLSSVLTTLGRVPDIQRGITRIFHRTATPAEVANDFTRSLLICTICSSL